MQGSAKDKGVVALSAVIAQIRAESATPKKLKGAAKMLASGQAIARKSPKTNIGDEDGVEEVAEEGDEPETITPSPKKPKPAESTPAKKPSPCQRLRRKKSMEDEVLFICAKPSKDREELEGILAEIAAIESRREALTILCYSEFNSREPVRLRPLSMPLHHPWLQVCVETWRAISERCLGSELMLCDFLLSVCTPFAKFFYPI